MPNPSELARQQEEYQDLYLLIKGGNLPKSEKQYALTRLRLLESNLGIEGKNYNSSDF